jgi:ribonuclease Z
MMTWVQGRPEPLTVFGPLGGKQVVDGFSQAYALDRAYRTAHHGESYLNPARGEIIAREVVMDTDSAMVLDDGSLKVTMFKVDYAPIRPAVG